MSIGAGLTVKLPSIMDYAIVVKLVVECVITELLVS
jgi:hypothetical protein